MAKMPVSKCCSLEGCGMSPWQNNSETLALTLKKRTTLPKVKRILLGKYGIEQEKKPVEKLQEMPSRKVEKRVIGSLEPRCGGG